MYNDRLYPLSWIEIDGVNSLRDFGAYILKSSGRGAVKKRTNFFDIPYNNYPLATDFSDIYGGAVYEMRQLKYTFRLICSNSLEMYKKYTQFVKWLTNAKSQKIYDSEYPEFYFIGKLAGVSEIKKKTISAGDFDVTFNCNPFRRSIDYADIPFDKYNLETDYFNRDTISIGIDREQSPYETDPIIHVYNYANRAICPRLSFDRLNTEKGLDIWITPVSEAGAILENERIKTRVYRENTGLFTQTDFILQPGYSMIQTFYDADNNYGRLTINLWEEEL